MLCARTVGRGWRDVVPAPFFQRTIWKSFLPVTKSCAGGRVPLFGCGSFLSPPVSVVLLIADASWNGVLKSRVRLVPNAQGISGLPRMWKWGTEEFHSLPVGSAICTLEGTGVWLQNSPRLSNQTAAFELPLLQVATLLKQETYVTCLPSWKILL